MSLPRAVIEAEQLADEVVQQLSQVTETETQAPPPEQPAAQEQVVAPQPAPELEDEGWKQRYKSLEGKYKAEVPRLLSSNKELQAQLSTLAAEIEALKSATPRESLVKPEEVDQFGEPLVDLIRRAAREETSSKDHEINALKKRLESFEAVNAKNTEVGFYERLNQLVSDWVEINDNGAFHAWLSEHDELTGRQRQELLSDAENARDANRVAKFFDAWKRTQQTKAATSTASLASQVVPDATKGGSVPPGKRIWSRAEIDSVYNRARRGEIRDSDLVAIESDIQAALIEGRIK
jgi:hypothetical protein